MNYSVRLRVDGAIDDQLRCDVERRYRLRLEAALGSATGVVMTYLAWCRVDASPDSAVPNGDWRRAMQWRDAERAARTHALKLLRVRASRVALEICDIRSMLPRER